MPHIRLVDGFKIRQTLDIDFAFLHTHQTHASFFGRTFYIPEGEWWLDHTVKDELDLLWKCNEIEIKNTSYVEQRAETKRLCLPPPIPEYVHSREEKDRVEIVMVDGKIVRQYMDPAFAFGGHHFVYSYVPEREIWLDARMDPAEVPFVLLHEQTERTLMMKENKSYDVAHDYATVAEKEVRRNNGASYPGDANYPWFGKTNQELATMYDAGK